MVRIACAQMAMSANMEENYQKSLDYVRRAATAGAGIICFPEGQLSQYIAQYAGLSGDDFAISRTHPYIQGFCQACREHHIVGVFSLALREKDRHIYSDMLVIDETGQLVTTAAKNHIVRAPHFYEQDYFTPGNDGFLVAPTRAGRIGLIVCFDRHYPESFRSLALQGADVIITAVANETSEPRDVFQWEMRIPAFQNSLYTVMINRTGREGMMDFCGESLVAGPDGSVVALAGTGEELLLADLDFAKAAALHQEKQYLSLRRPGICALP